MDEPGMLASCEVTFVIGFEASVFDPEPVRAVANAGYDSRVRVFRCGNIVDSFAITTERYLIVVDTMVSRNSMEPVMTALAGDLQNTTRTLLVINTHADWDHVCGNGLFVGPEARYPAPIIGHRLTAEAMVTPAARELLRTFQADYPGPYDTAGWWPPTLCCDGELTIDGGDLSVRLVPTPGHTPDHVSIWIPELRLLLAGDAAEMPFPEAADGRSLPTLRASLERLERFRADMVLYSHAPGVTDPALIRHNIKYFDELERRCRTTVTPRTISEIGAADDPARLIDWPFEDALPPGVSVSDLSPAEFYRAGHNSAIRAMLSWLNGS
jgi:glyoxylase-like metal-dependent hydrolase (beta-lactamase superfamily II)